MSEVLSSSHIGRKDIDKTVIGKLQSVKTRHDFSCFYFFFLFLHRVKKVSLRTDTQKTPKPPMWGGRKRKPLPYPAYKETMLEDEWEGKRGLNRGITDWPWKAIFFQIPFCSTECDEVAGYNSNAKQTSKNKLLTAYEYMQSNHKGVPQKKQQMTDLRVVS